MDEQNWKAQMDAAPLAQDDDDDDDDDEDAIFYSFEDDPC